VSYDPFTDETPHIGVGPYDFRLGLLAHCLGIPAATLASLRPGPNGEPARCVVVPREDDDPQWDATDFSHPAWWRGDDHGCAAVVRIVTAVLEGQQPGTYGNPDLTALCQRIAALAAAQEHGHD